MSGFEWIRCGPDSGCRVGIGVSKCSMRDNQTSRDAQHVRSAIGAHLEPENDYFKTVIKVLYLKSGSQMDYNDAETL
jgi:hypothetical protein